MKKKVPLKLLPVFNFLKEISIYPLPKMKGINDVDETLFLKKLNLEISYSWETFSMFRTNTPWKEIAYTPMFSDVKERIKAWADHLCNGDSLA
jgi:hypothetical protein